MTFTICRSAERFENETPPCEGAVNAGKKGRFTEWQIDINTLEELLLLADEVKHPIIVDVRDMSLEIYDDWRE